MLETVTLFLLNITFVELCGWFGAICLACCAIPQARMSLVQGHAHGVSSGLLWLWSLGEIFTLIFLVYQPVLNWPLIMNYTANIIFVSVIVWFKLFPRET